MFIFKKKKKNRLQDNTKQPQICAYTENFSTISIRVQNTTIE